MNIVADVPLKCRANERNQVYLKWRANERRAELVRAMPSAADIMKLPSRSLSYANRPAPLLSIQYYIYTRVDKRPRSRPTLDSPWHKRARFGEAEQKSYLCISRKRKSAGFSSFRVLRGQLSYMSGKIVLYDRKNYKQARENLLGDNFYEVLYREKFL